MSETLLAVRKAVDSLHRRPHMAVIYATGAGAGLQYMLWETPGASRTILDSAFPYHPQALEDILGRKPDGSVRQETAVLMAGAAYARAMAITQRSGISAPLLGLGITAAVETDRTRKGADRVFAAVKTEGNVYVEEMEFEKGAMNRQTEGFCIDFLGLNMLLHAADLDQVSAPYPGKADPKPVLGPVGDPLSFPFFIENGVRAEAMALDPSRHVLYPGSFNPLHYGHIAAAREVERMTGKRVVFHITCDHPEKGKIPVADIERRVRQFVGIAPVLVTSGDSFYADKAKRFPGLGFVIGADAVLNIMNPAYYTNDKCSPQRSFEKFAQFGSRFHVTGREVGGTFTTLADLPIPEEFRRLFSSVPGRWDVASRDLRAKKT